jgi:hypothetical protein
MIIYHFYAFDSFAGMPEPIGIDRQKIWRKGMNHTSLERFRSICKDDLHRITTVAGFFSDSLRTFRWNEKEKIALAYIDFSRSEPQQAHHVRNIASPHQWLKLPHFG